MKQGRALTTAPTIVENTAEAQFLVRLVIPPHQHDAVSAALRAEEAHAQRHQSSAFDTPDRRLAARGVFLSLCKRGREWVQVAMATTPDSTRLLVHEVDLGTRKTGVVPTLLPHLHEGTEVGAAISAAVGHAPVDEVDGESALVSVFSIDLTRLTRTIAQDGAVVEVAQTTGSITTDTASTSFQELEFRLVSGPMAPMFALAQQWSTRHGLSISTVSNGERGARLAAGHPEGFPTTAVAPKAPFMDGANFLHATLDSCLTQVLANASVVVDGPQDRHVIEQLRDGLERLRTALARLKSMASDMDDAWEPVLKRIFHELASHHCATALRTPLMQEMRAAGLSYALTSSHPRESRSPSAIVRDPELQAALMGLLAYRHALAPPFRPGHGSLKQMRTRFAAELAKCRNRVEGDTSHLGSTPRRRRASRHLAFLYRLATFVGPLYEARQVDRFLVRCRVAQDAFVTDSDHRLGLDALEDDGDGGHDAKLARRWLASRLVEDRKQCEASLLRVGKASPFWR